MSCWSNSWHHCNDLEIIHQNTFHAKWESEEFSTKCIDKSLCKSGLTAEMVTSFSQPNVSVISTMGCRTFKESRTFKEISITEISESLGIKSVFLTSLRVAHRGWRCSNKCFIMHVIQWILWHLELNLVHQHVGILFLPWNMGRFRRVVKMDCSMVGTGKSFWDLGNFHDFLYSQLKSVG